MIRAQIDAILQRDAARAKLLYQQAEAARLASEAADPEEAARLAAEVKSYADAVSAREAAIRAEYNRSTRFVVQLTPDERERILAAAAAAGRTPSDWVRRTLLGEDVAPGLAPAKREVGRG